MVLHVLLVQGFKTGARINNFLRQVLGNVLVEGLDYVRLLGIEDGTLDRVV